MFGLFARKSTLDDAEASPEFKTNDQGSRLPTPTPSIASIAHRNHSPLRFSLRAVLGGSTTGLPLKASDLATASLAEGGNNVDSPAPPPPDTPTPPPVGPLANESKTLYDLMLTIPPKILHSYTLAHLRPQPPLPTSTSSPTPGRLPDNTPRPPSPDTVTKLTAFFSTLAPPPLLHCMRCHKDFYDIENEGKDKACRVPHDDESALVSRVSGGGYETLWGCCGQTASGDGSEGPPDGWCYEGTHTVSFSSNINPIHPTLTPSTVHQVDIRRARFRADSTIHDDKLTSCLKLNCRGIRDQLPRRDSRASQSRNVGSSSARRSNPSPVRSQASVLAPRSARKRPRKSLKEASGSENEADAESVGRAAKTKEKEKVGNDAGERDEDKSMAVDESNPPSKPRAKAKSRPITRAHPPPSTSTTASIPTSGSNVTPVVSSKARTTTTRPKPISRTLLSQSHVHPASDSEASTRSRPRTRSQVKDESRVRNARATPLRDASRNRTTSKLTKADIPELVRRARKALKRRSQSPSSEGEPDGGTDECQESAQEGRGRDRKRRRVRRD